MRRFLFQTRYITHSAHATERQQSSPTKRTGGARELLQMAP